MRWCKSYNTGCTKDGNPFVNEEELIQDWLAYTEGDAKEEIIRKYVKESGKTFDWLESNFDFHFGEKMFAFYHTSYGRYGQPIQINQEQIKILHI